MTANSIHPRIVRTRITRDGDGLLTGNSNMFILLCYFLYFLLGSYPAAQYHILGKIDEIIALPSADLVFFLASKLLKSIYVDAVTLLKKAMDGMEK